MQVVDAEIGGLQQQQAELLRQLAAVEQNIAAAKAKRVSNALALVLPLFFCPGPPPVASPLPSSPVLRQHKPSDARSTFDFWSGRRRKTWSLLSVKSCLD